MIYGVYTQHTAVGTTQQGICFKAILIDDDPSLREVSWYANLNPVQAQQAHYSTYCA